MSRARNRKKKPKFVPSGTDLGQLNSSFAYEVGVLISQGKLYLAEGAALAKDEARLYPTADALFDSLLVRLRSFDSFLRNMATFGTEAVARHVVPGWQARATLTADQRKMISVRSAHLTYQRPPAHEWPIGEMIRLALERSATSSSQLVCPQRSGSIASRRSREWLARWGDGDRVWTENDNHAHRR